MAGRRFLLPRVLHLAIESPFIGKRVMLEVQNHISPATVLCVDHRAVSPTGSDNQKSGSLTVASKQFPLAT
jgi:hypothetical protein